MNSGLDHLLAQPKPLWLISAIQSIKHATGNYDSELKQQLAESAARVAAGRRPEAGKLLSQIRQTREALESERGILVIMRNRKEDVSEFVKRFKQAMTIENVRTRQRGLRSLRQNVSGRQHVWAEEDRRMEGLPDDGLHALKTILARLDTEL